MRGSPHTYPLRSELLTDSQERIASNILADRLQKLVKLGIIVKSHDPASRSSRGSDFGVARHNRAGDVSPALFLMLDARGVSPNVRKRTGRGSNRCSNTAPMYLQ